MESVMPEESRSDRAEAIAQIPGGLFLLTANFEDHRHAVLVKWVQQCSDNPPMVMVALSKGQPVEPLIRESRRFVLCQISADDRFLTRKFAQREHDPLVTLMTSTSPNGSPIIDRAMSYLDCEVVRHIELDSDHRVYVGQVHAGAVLNDGTPAVFFGINGNRRASS
jgi:3-hydroxy-9,10-secoandrosta-1,3,5(10)-triene-9,17-dione monooxygenase reductase component